MYVPTVVHLSQSDEEVLISPQLTSRLLDRTLKRLPELPTIRHRAQDPRPLRRMRISIDPIDRRLLAALAAPPVAVAHEEQLILREVLQAREVLVFLDLAVGLPRLERGRETACVGDVLAEGEAAVDVEGLVVGAGDGVVVVLVYEALCALLECVDGAVGPPVLHDVSACDGQGCLITYGVVAILIIMPTRAVEGMGELVACHRTKCAIRQICRNVDIEHRELHNTSWEDDLVARRVVVRVDCRHGHAPFIAINRLAQCLPLLPNTELSHVDRIAEKVARGQVEVAVIFLEVLGVHDIRALGGISNLLDNIVDLEKRLLHDDLRHPLGVLELDSKLVFDVRHDPIAEDLGLGRECLLDEEAGEDPADTAIDVAQAGPPALGHRLWISSYQLVAKTAVGLDLVGFDVAGEGLDGFPEEVVLHDRRLCLRDDIRQLPHVFWRSDDNLLGDIASGRQILQQSLQVDLRCELCSLVERVRVIVFLSTVSIILNVEFMHVP